MLCKIVDDTDSITKDNNLITKPLMIFKQVHKSLDFIGIALVDSFTLLQIAHSSITERVIDVTEISREPCTNLNAFRIGEIAHFNELSPASNIKLWPYHVY